MPGRQAAFGRTDRKMAAELRRGFRPIYRLLTASEDRQCEIGNQRIARVAEW
jgi:hypothetical protein